MVFPRYVIVPTSPSEIIAYNIQLIIAMLIIIAKNNVKLSIKSSFETYTVKEKTHLYKAWKMYLTKLHRGAIMITETRSNTSCFRY